MSRVIVGVDAGGSATSVALVDATGKEHTAQGRAANLRTHGVEGVAATVASTVGSILPPNTVDAIFAGAAGVGSAETIAALRAALAAQFPSARIGVSDDAHVALRAAVPEGDGIVLIVGTGSIAYAEIGGGRFRAGGHGHLIGDDGSGFAIGAAAVKLLARAYDGRVPFDAMLEALAAKLGTASAQDIIDRVYGSPSAVRDLAALTPLVLDSADAGERSATKIVQGAALELFDLLKAVVRAAQAGSLAVPLVFAGGLFQRNSLLTYLIETRVSNEYPLLQPLKGAPRAHYGALAEARRLLLDV